MSPIIIKTFNPYESRFPDRKLVSREILILIKMLRSRGIEINVMPNDNKPIEYLFQKGLREFFADPTIMYILGIPTSIIPGLITNYLYRLTEKKKREGRSIINIKNLIINYKEVNKSYFIDGNEISFNYHG